MKNRTFNILSLLSLIVLFIYFIRIIPTLPDEIPMNIGSDGNITSWGSKYSLWLFASIPLIIFASYKVYEHFANRLNSDRDNSGDERIILLLIIALFSYIAILYTEMIRTMEYNEVDSDFFLKGIMLGMGVLMLGIGNYLPRIHKNRSLGIRLPWTLKNEEVWDKTHQFGGKTSVVTGILMILVTLIGFKYYWVYATILMILGIAVIPSIYAYKLYHKIVK